MASAQHGLDLERGEEQRLERPPQTAQRGAARAPGVVGARDTRRPSARRPPRHPHRGRRRIHPPTGVVRRRSVPANSIARARRAPFRRTEKRMASSEASLPFAPPPLHRATTTTTTTVDMAHHHLHLLAARSASTAWRAAAAAGPERGAAPEHHPRDDEAAPPTPTARRASSRGERGGGGRATIARRAPNLVRGAERDELGERDRAAALLADRDELVCRSAPPHPAVFVSFIE